MSCEYRKAEYVELVAARRRYSTWDVDPESDRTRTFLTLTMDAVEVLNTLCGSELPRFRAPHFLVTYEDGWTPCALIEVAEVPGGVELSIERHDSPYGDKEYREPPSGTFREEISYRGDYFVRWGTG